MLWGMVVVITAAGVTAQPVAQVRGGGQASVLDDPRVQTLGEEGLDLLYDMQLAEAEARFDEIDRLYPAYPIGPFLKGLITWWQILPDLNDESHDDRFIEQMEEVIKRSDRLLKKNEDDFDAQFFKGAALGFRGRLRSDRGQWLRAARDGKQAMDYVLRVAKQDTTNADYMFGKGVYDYFAAMVPKKYPVVKPLMVFFPKGNRDRGLRELQFTAESGRFIRTEAVYFLLQIYYLYEPNYQKSLDYITWLRTEHPRNGFFHLIEGRVYVRWGRRRESMVVFEDILARYQAGQAGYTATLAEQALYYLAQHQMAFRRYDDALAHLLQLEALAGRHKEDTYFKVMGRLRQGMIYDLQNRRAWALQRYQEVLKMKDWSDAHERAKRYIDTPYER